ncbi:MAG: hypothetical protein L0G99_14935, partial [Propionibacteriales bacterium]|nr:hypothetical protein [Propionibacteriales bacterium]
RRPGIGWPVVVLAVVAAAVAGALCWQVGEALGPQDFDTRLRTAKPGEVVPIDFTLRAKAALLLWPLGASAAFIAIGATVRDTEEPRPMHIGRGRQGRARADDEAAE